MKQQLHRILFEFTLGTQSCIRLFINYEIEFGELLSECIPLLKKFISVDFLCSESLIQRIEADPFLLSRLYQLRNLGANFYAVPNNETILICEADFKKSLVIYLNEQGEKYSIEQFDHVSVHHDWIEGIVSSQKEFKTEVEDIHLWFAVEDQLVLQQQKTILRWDVANVHHLTLVGVGSVSLEGQKTIQVLNDTIVTLLARNKTQIKMKSIFIKSIKKLVLNYHLQFYNVSAKRFEGLEEIHDSGVFGVIKGSKLKLIWEIESSGGVKISPFNINVKKGEHEFLVNDFMEIKIWSESQEQVTQKTLRIQEFPVPVFKHEFIEVKDQFIEDKTIVLNDFQQQAFDFISRKGHLGNSLMEQVILKNELIESGIKANSQALGFDDFYKENSVSKMNQAVKRRLLNYFRERPSITNLIKDLRNYYE